MKADKLYHWITAPLLIFDLMWILHCSRYCCFRLDNTYRPIKPCMTVAAEKDKLLVLSSPSLHFPLWCGLLFKICFVIHSDLFLETLRSRIKCAVINVCIRFCALTAQSKIYNFKIVLFTKFVNECFILFYWKYSIQLNFRLCWLSVGGRPWMTLPYAEGGRRKRNSSRARGSGSKSGLFCVT